MKIIKVDKTVIVITDSGKTFQKFDCSESEFNRIQNCTTEEELLLIMCPDYADKVKEATETKELISKTKNSNILTMRGDSVYWTDVCELSMPKQLVEAVIKAEECGDEDKITSYKNFWTLASLNPDSRCRENLFWFLEKWGMKISKSGMFICYRNAVTLKDSENSKVYSQELISFVESEYERRRKNHKSTSSCFLEYDEEDEYWKTTKDNTGLNLKALYDEFKAGEFNANKINKGKDIVFTDAHSRTTRIKIGELVSMPREKTDTCQENSCSRGLHVAGKDWLEKGYFGDTGLVCLCNPAKVVAVPTIDQYGKLRTCEYLPIAIAEYNENGKLIEYNVEDGFDNSYIPKLIYEGDFNTENSTLYSLYIPTIPEINSENITKNVYNIALEAIKNKKVNG